MLKVYYSFYEIHGEKMKINELPDVILVLGVICKIFWARDSFPMVTKEAMSLQGLPAGSCRRPIGPISEENRRELKGILKNMGLL